VLAKSPEEEEEEEEGLQRGEEEEEYTGAIPLSGADLHSSAGLCPSWDRVCAPAAFRAPRGGIKREEYGMGLERRVVLERDRAATTAGARVVAGNR